MPRESGASSTPRLRFSVDKPVVTGSSAFADDDSQGPFEVSRQHWALPMSPDAVAITGFVVLFALMLLRVPVGMAMGLVGVSGFAYLVGGGPALKLVGQTSMRTVTDYTFGVIPMFLLM